MKKNYIYNLFLAFPIIDLITSILIRSNIGLTLGMIVKGTFAIIMFFYVIFSKSKYKKISLITYLIMFLFVIFYFGFKPELLSIKHIINEFTYLFKLLFYPFIFVSLLLFFDDYTFEKEKIIKIMKINLIVMSIFLVVPILLKNAYLTYPDYYRGTIGWFYSGNEIANIMILLYGVSLYMYKDKSVLNKLLLIPIIFSIFRIGTKVSLLGLIIISILNIIYFLFKDKKIKSRNIIISIIILIGIILFSFNSYTVLNYNANMNKNDQLSNNINITNKNQKKLNSKLEQINKFYNSSKFNILFKTLLNGREIFLANTMTIYDEINIPSKILFGIGYSNTNKVNDNNISKLIEMDVLDSFYHWGLIGLLLMLTPYIITIILILKSKRKFNLDSFYYSLILLLIFGISTLSGHVFASPAVVVYIILYFMLLLNEFNKFDTNLLIDDKVTILSLHMGFGGIERSIVNQANMISKTKNVEIISLYKLKEECFYELNKNVKLTYLSNISPNKKEIKEALKNKQTFILFKELIKGLIILYKKQKLVQDYVLECNSKYIISTRIEFTQILNTYGRKDIIKIAEEHVYHNENKKYINKLKRSLKNINYLIPASKYLTDDYKKYFEKEKVKVIYIPQSIDYLPKKCNNLDTYNILYVSRLEREKATLDLIDIMHDVVKLNNKIKLTIVGDGSEYNLINNKINNLNLNKNIKMTGFLSGDKLNKEYSKASLYVMTSFEESFGLVLLEAMGYGIPCIAFDSALGAKEIINNKNGILIKNRNHNKMVKEITNYFRNNDNKNMGKYARETFLKYYSENVEKEWNDFLK